MTNSELHRVDDLLQLAAALGIDLRPDIVLPAKTPIAARGAYAVLHANPIYQNKRWTDEGWHALAETLRQHGLVVVVVTGGPAQAKKLYLDRVWNPVRPSVDRVDGWLSWGELAQLLSSAAVYVGRTLR